METSIGFKKFWMSPMSADGSIGKDWVQMQNGGRQGTGKFMGAAPSVTSHKNFRGVVLDNTIVAGEMTVSFQLADVTAANLAMVTGGTVTETAESVQYTPNTNKNSSIELSVAILTDKGVYILIPRCSFNSFPAFSDDDLHYYEISGTVLLPYVEEEAEYTVHKLDAAQLADTKILGFALEEQTGAATINHTTKAITIQVATGTDVTALTPEITYALAADSKPMSGEAVDFTAPVAYIVEAGDGTKATYTVTVTVAV